MSRGLLNVLSIADDGGDQYTLTVVDSTGVSVGDHIGARVVLDGAVYRVTSIPNGTTIVVQDDLIEAESSVFGVPNAGVIGYGTPEPNNNLTQLPFDSPGWDAAGRRNLYLLDNLSSGGGGAPGVVETRAIDSTITSADNGKILYIAGGSTVALTFDSGLPQGFEITVIADADASVEVIPASGQKIGDGSQPPLYGAVDEKMVSKKVSQGNSTQICTGRWKLVNTSWIPLYSASGWDPGSNIIISLEFRDSDQTTVITDGDMISLSTGGPVKSIYLYDSQGNPVDMSYTPDDRIFNALQIQESGTFVDTTGVGVTPGGQGASGPPVPPIVGNPASITDVQGFSMLTIGEIQITPSASVTGQVTLVAWDQGGVQVSLVIDVM